MKHKITLRTSIAITILFTLFTNAFSQNLIVNRESKSGLQPDEEVFEEMRI